MKIVIPVAKSAEPLRGKHHQNAVKLYVMCMRIYSSLRETFWMQEAYSHA
jgi:hypothetical protein